VTWSGLTKATELCVCVCVCVRACVMYRSVTVVEHRRSQLLRCQRGFHPRRSAQSLDQPAYITVVSRPASAAATVTGSAASGRHCGHPPSLTLARSVVDGAQPRTRAVRQHSSPSLRLTIVMHVVAIYTDAFLAMIM